MMKMKWYWWAVIVLAVILTAYLIFFKKASASTDGKKTEKSEFESTYAEKIQKAQQLYDTDSAFKNNVLYLKGQAYIQEKAVTNGTDNYTQALLDALWMKENPKK